MSRRIPESFFPSSRFDVSARRDRADGPHDPPAVPASNRPAAVYVPEGYEPNYAYPLVVWFHDAGEDERVLHHLMPKVTDRNAVGLALRGDRVGRDRFDWSRSSAVRQNDLVAAIRDLRREYHVHTERVILAGRGTGAAAASDLFFARPEWFGGLAMFDPPAEAFARELVSHDDLVGKPVLLDLPLNQLGRGREGVSRLAASGLDVTFRHTRFGGLGPTALRHLDRWLMAAVCGVSV